MRCSRRLLCCKLQAALDTYRLRIFLYRNAPTRDFGTDFLTWVWRSARHCGFSPEAPGERLQLWRLSGGRLPRGVTQLWRFCYMSHTCFWLTALWVDFPDCRGRRQDSLLGPFDPLLPGSLLGKWLPALLDSPLNVWGTDPPALSPEEPSARTLVAHWLAKTKAMYMPGDRAAVGENKSLLFLRLCRRAFSFFFLTVLPPPLPFFLFSSFFWSERLFWKTSWIVDQEKKKIEKTSKHLETWKEKKKISWL